MALNEVRSSSALGCLLDLSSVQNLARRALRSRIFVPEPSTWDTKGVIAGGEAMKGTVESRIGISAGGLSEATSAR